MHRHRDTKSLGFGGTILHTAHLSPSRQSNPQATKLKRKHYEISKLEVLLGVQSDEFPTNGFRQQRTCGCGALTCEQPQA